MSAPTIAWTPATTVDIEIAHHAGRDADARLAAVVAVDYGTSPDGVYLPLDPPADADWDDILSAVTAIIRTAGCPDGPITWGAGVDVYDEDCGCQWASREVAWPRPASLTP